MTRGTLSNIRIFFSTLSGTCFTEDMLHIFYRTRRTEDSIFERETHSDLDIRSYLFLFSPRRTRLTAAEKILENVLEPRKTSHTLKSRKSRETTHPFERAESIIV